MNDRAVEPEGMDRPGHGSEPSKPGTRAFKEAQTDSWILPGEPERGSDTGSARPQPRPWHEVGPPPRERPDTAAPDLPRSPAYVGGAGSSDEPGRPGPVALDEDNWDADPNNRQATVYAGRRRGGTSMRTWLGIAAAIVLLAAAVGLPFLLHSSAPTTQTAGIGAPDNNGDLPTPARSATGPAGQLGNPASGAPALSSSAGPQNSAEALQILASALAAQGQGGGGGAGGGQIPGIPGLPAGAPTTTTAPGQPAPPPPTTTAPESPQPPAPPARFPTTTIQAESGTHANGAVVRSAMCSGNPQVVGPLGSVTMTIPGTIPTAGTYEVQVFFTDPLFLIESGSISANGAASQSFTVLGPANCPSSAGTFNVTLHAGTGNTITISGRTFGLNIDRIAVSQP